MKRDNFIIITTTTESDVDSKNYAGKTRFLKICLIFLVFCGFLSCNSEPVMEQVDEPPVSTLQLSDDELRVLHQMRSPNNRVCIEEAAQLAIEVADFFESNTLSTRQLGTAPQRRIGAVDILRIDKQDITLRTQSDDVQNMSDTLAYIFNFENELGFVIVAADTRVESPMLAFVDNGSLGDTIDNPGIMLFLEGVVYYIEQSIAEAEHLRDSLLVDILNKIWKYGDTGSVGVDSTDIATRIAPPPATGIGDIDGWHTSIYTSTHTSFGAWQIFERVGPLLPVEWGQDAPFNNSVTVLCGIWGRAPAGCVAVAIAQIMAYWRHPASIDGRSLNWDILREHTANPNRYPGVGSRWLDEMTADGTTFRVQVAHLMRRIGAGVNMDYGCGGSGAARDAAIGFLRNHGYSVGSLRNFDLTTVITSLNNRHPVYIRGNSTRTITTTSFLGITLSTRTTYGGGHAWVVDGYMRRRRPVTVTTTVSRLGLDGHWTSTTTTNTHHETATYLHNNWGWDGLGSTDSWLGRYHGKNGYYRAGVFNSNQAPAHSSSTRSGTPGNFQFNIEIISHIHR